MKKIHFERAIFTSWYCSLGDCTYCYMSTQKSLIEDPVKARRRMSSMLAEVFLGHKLGWKIGALSAGYGSYTQESILELCKNVFEITKEKMWLNIGVLPEPTIKILAPYLEGIYGAVETVNEEVHKKVAPNKPIAPIEKMYGVCDAYGLKKSMTFIVGMGETIADFPKLQAFVAKHKIDKVTFYALNPIKGTMFENDSGPSIEYYLEWIRKTAQAFPEIDVVAGMWVNRVDKISDMLKAGATSITKFPALNLFNTNFAKTIEQEVEKGGCEFVGTLTRLPEIDIGEIDSYSFDATLKTELKEKVTQYLESMEKNANKVVVEQLQDLGD